MIRVEDFLNGMANGIANNQQQQANMPPQDGYFATHYGQGKPYNGNTQQVAPVLAPKILQTQTPDFNYTKQPHPVAYDQVKTQTQDNGMQDTVNGGGLNQPSQNYQILQNQNQALQNQVANLNSGDKQQLAQIYNNSLAATGADNNPENPSVLSRHPFVSTGLGALIGYLHNRNLDEYARSGTLESILGGALQGGEYAGTKKQAWQQELNAKKMEMAKTLLPIAAKQGVNNSEAQSNLANTLNTNLKNQTILNSADAYGQQLTNIDPAYAPFVKNPDGSSKLLNKDVIDSFDTGIGNLQTEILANEIANSGVKAAGKTYDNTFNKYLGNYPVPVSANGLKQTQTKKPIGEVISNKQTYDAVHEYQAIEKTFKTLGDDATVQNYIKNLAQSDPKKADVVAKYYNRKQELAQQLTKAGWLNKQPQQQAPTNQGVVISSGINYDDGTNGRLFSKVPANVMASMQRNYMDTVVGSQEKAADNAIDYKMDSEKLQETKRKHNMDYSLDAQKTTAYVKNINNLMSNRNLDGKLKQAAFNLKEDNQLTPDVKLLGSQYLTLQSGQPVVTENGTYKPTKENIAKLRSAIYGMTNGYDIEKHLYHPGMTQIMMNPNMMPSTPIDNTTPDAPQNSMDIGTGY